jgi:hypothetical protein
MRCSDSLNRHPPSSLARKLALDLGNDIGFQREDRQGLRVVRVREIGPRLLLGLTLVVGDGAS